MAATNVRDTSLLALDEIRKKGILKGAFLRVYETLFEYGPMTAHELTRHFNEQGSRAFTTYQPRLTELEDVKAVARVGRRHDRHTNHLAYEWDVTSHVPTRELRSRRQRGPKGKRVHVPSCVSDAAQRAPLVDELVDVYNKGTHSEAFFELVSWLVDMDKLPIG